MCTFNIPVSMPHALTCESVVVSTTLELLGVDPQCYFTSETKMVIVMGANATIAPASMDEVFFENLTYVSGRM